MTHPGYPGVLLGCPASSTLTVNWSQIGPDTAPAAGRTGGQHGQGPGGSLGSPEAPPPPPHSPLTWSRRKYPGVKRLGRIIMARRGAADHPPPAQLQQRGWVPPQPRDPRPDLCDGGLRLPPACRSPRALGKGVTHPASAEQLSAAISACCSPERTRQGWGGDQCQPRARLGGREKRAWQGQPRCRPAQGSPPASVSPGAKEGMPKEG